MTKNHQLIAASFTLTSIIATSACSTINQDTNAAIESDLETRQAALAEQEGILRQRQADLDQREKELQASVNGQQKAVPAYPGSALIGSGEELLPPNAQPGECYTRLWVPPEYKRVQEKILTREASERISIQPAQFQMAQKRVLVQEAATKLISVPATYKTVTERVLVKPASKKIVQVPAQYETVTERVLDKPAHTVWKKGSGPIQRIDDTTGEIMCLVEIPATYKTINRRVIKSPATTRILEQPAIYKTVTKKVIDVPAHTKTVEIPAKYQTIEVSQEAAPASESRTEIPAEYTTIIRNELVSDGHMEWRSILCDTNITADRILQIQQALAEKGFDPGPIDGVIGVETMRAVNQYQEAEGLPVDRYLNIATVKSLGVSPR